MPLKLVQLSETRWLAWSKAVDNIVAQWQHLKSHFDLHVKSLRPSDKCVIGRKLHEYYQDDSNLLHLLFLKPIAAHMARVNANFQAENAEVSL